MLFLFFKGKVTAMGGIWFCIYDTKYSNVKFDTDFIRSFSNLQHRGRDYSQLIFEQTIPLDSVNRDILKRTLKRSEIATFGQFTFAYGYHRLSINDPSYDGHQPFQLIDKTARGVTRKKTSMCNGEIYNWRDIKAQMSLEELESENDCEIILHMYDQFIKKGLTPEESITQILNLLDGEFSFVVTGDVQTYDLKGIQSFVARDPLGIKPLYYVKKNDNSLFLFVSELKGIPQKFLDNKDYTISEFPPGHYWSFSKKTFTQYFTFPTLPSPLFNDTKPETVEKLYSSLEMTLKNSIYKRIRDVKKIGITLGGVDSVILANLVLQLIEESSVEVYFFTIGNILMEGDIHWSQQCVNHFRNFYNRPFQHSIVYVTDSVEPNVDKESIENTLETEDPDIIEYCIPFFLLYEHISKNYPDIKVILSGDGCEDLFNENEMSLHKTTALRVDKISSLFGLETRLPYLDKDVVNLFRNIGLQLKGEVNGVDKYILRKSNDVSDNPLPHTILYRTHQLPFVRIETNKSGEI